MQGNELTEFSIRTLVMAKGQCGNDSCFSSYSAASAASSCSMDSEAYNYVKQFHDDSFKLGQNTDEL